MPIGCTAFSGMIGGHGVGNGGGMVTAVAWSSRWHGGVSCMVSVAWSVAGPCQCVVVSGAGFRRGVSVWRSPFYAICNMLCHVSPMVGVMPVQWQGIEIT